ncbi:HAD hydrolase-like protein [Alteriqipengyuania lutimaris]|uniref:Phosphoglycolate phosphatase n=1 Tax=Alteriqipengyuania lutimaris TaxID=1538146 RepID=A0A395LIP0_9SPHN|nr:HAD hydrolase-like protein [Alteriqipengyuania lutimaris]MBB3035539.1 phosphoglycolate phosphatase [Alteriqipengyuania lutimaris]RDS76157.1 HAD family hydrolase [Alteriqipengyuania lutimaris]
MSDFPFAAIGLDLDGTLLDTKADLAAAVNHALAEGGYEQVPAEQVEGLIGGGAKVMLARAIEAQGGSLEDADFRPLYKSLLRYYSDHNAVYTQPFPGVIETLDELAAMDVTLAVVTNKFESFAAEILAALGLRDRFVTLIGGDSLGKDAEGNFRAKPAADPILAAIERCGGGPFAFVGDSSYDVMAARAAKVPVVAAGYGYCEKPKDLGADAVIDRFADLVPALRRIAPAS